MPLADEPEPTRHLRGTGLALAIDWMTRIPESDRRAEALEQLGAAVDLACRAATT